MITVVWTLTKNMMNKNMFNIRLFELSFYCFANSRLVLVGLMALIVVGRAIFTL